MSSNLNGAGVPARWIAVLVGLGLTACSPRWEVYTCSFGTGQSGCELIKAALQPRDWHELHFTLVNPNTQQVGCAGSVSVSVNSAKKGYLTWHGEELDASTCARVGDEIAGEKALAGDGAVTDLFFPEGDYTFRVAARPESGTPLGDPHQ